MARVRFHEIYKRFGSFEVIQDLNLDVEDGEFVTLVGPSGCGKTTTLRMVAGLEEITSGELYIGDVLSNNIPPKKRGISMVFQSYALFPHMTVSENIAFGLKIRRYPRSQVLERVAWAVNLLKLQGLDRRLPRDLSGGQRQRVAFARALVLEPKVLLLDEPLSNLDAKLRLRMRAELKRIHKKLKSTIIYVTHDQVEAMSLSDRVAIMHEGRLPQVGTPLEVYNSPANIFVAGFIGSPSMNFLDGRIVGKGENLYMDLHSFQLLIPEHFRRRCAACVDREVVFGIRPEDIHDIRFAQGSEEGNAQDAIIDVVEPLGDRDILEAAVKGINLTLLSEAGRARADMPITLFFDMAKSHIFDRESGKNIFHS